MPLANDIIQNANQSIGDAGQSGNTALQAYHIAATAEHARQELDMEKQNQDMNKATWVMNGLSSLAKVPPGSQSIAAASFTKQLQQLYPDANPDVMTALQKDDDFRQQAIRAASVGVQQMTGGRVSAQGAQSVAGLFRGDLGGAANQFDHIIQADAMTQAAVNKSQGMNARVGAMQDNTVESALDKFDKDPNLMKLTPMGQSLGRDFATLNSATPDHPLTYQTLHENLMNVANVLGSGSLSDSRVNSITPHVSDEVQKQIESYFSSDPNKPADPKMVDYVKNLVGRLNTAVGSDVADRANTIANSRDSDLFNNPNISKAVQRKAKIYTSGAWRSTASGGTAPPTSQTPAAPAAKPPAALTPTAAAPPADFSHLSDAEVAAQWQALQAKKAGDQ